MKKTQYEFEDKKKQLGTHESSVKIKRIRIIKYESSLKMWKIEGMEQKEILIKA